MLKASTKNIQTVKHATDKINYKTEITWIKINHKNRNTTSIIDKINKKNKNTDKIKPQKEEKQDKTLDSSL